MTLKHISKKSAEVVVTVVAVVAKNCALFEEIMMVGFSFLKQFKSFQLHFLNDHSATTSLYKRL